MVHRNYCAFSASDSQMGSPCSKPQSTPDTKVVFAVYAAGIDGSDSSLRCLATRSRPGTGRAIRQSSWSAARRRTDRGAVQIGCDTVISCDFTRFIPRKFG